MKVSELKDFIRPIIAEEVQKQLPRLLFEMIGVQPRNVVHDSVQQPVIPPVVPNRAVRRVTETRTVSPTPVTKPQPPRKFVKDPILNQVLNEVTAAPPSSPYGGQSVVDMMGGDFEKIGQISDEFKSDLRDIMSESVNHNTNSPSYVPAAEEPVASPPDTSNVISRMFNKDFRAILKKSKEPGMGSGAPGMIQNW